MTPHEVVPERTQRVSVGMAMEVDRLIGDRDRADAMAIRMRRLLTAKDEELAAQRGVIRALESQVGQYEVILAELLEQLKGKR